MVPVVYLYMKYGTLAEENVDIFSFHNKEEFDWKLKKRLLSKLSKVGVCRYQVNVLAITTTKNKKNYASPQKGARNTVSSLNFQ
jgi:hypothetical protein